MTDPNQTTETLPKGTFPPCHLCRAPPCFPLSLSSCLNLSLWSETRGGIPQVERGHPHKQREMERHLCSCLSSDPNPSALALLGDFLELLEPGLSQHRGTAPKLSPTRHQAGNSLLSSSTCWDDTRADPGLSWVLGQVGCCAWETVPCFGAVCSQRASRQSQPVLGRPKWPGQPPQRCQGSGGSSQNPPTRAGDGPVGSATWILHPRSGQRVLVAPWAELNFAFCGPVSNQRSGKPVNFSSPWGSRQLGP